MRLLSVHSSARTEIWTHMEEYGKPPQVTDSKDITGSLKFRNATAVQVIVSAIMPLHL